MDISKLPKFGGDRDDRDAPTPAAPPPTPMGLDTQPFRPQATPYNTPAPAAPGGFAEAWLAIAVGVILLLLSPRLIQYLVAPESFAKKWSFTAPDGSPLAYPQTVFFWGDVALTAFAATLILEGLVLGFARRPIVAAAALAITAVVALGNLVYVVAMLAKGYDVQLMSALAVALGAYGCTVLYQRYRALQAAAAASSSIA